MTTTIDDSYRKQFPLYAAYRDVIAEYNTHKGPITEIDTSGLDTRQAAQVALARIGRPTDDPLLIAMADAYVHRLDAELAQDQPEPNLHDVVICHFLAHEGCVPSWEDWTARFDEDRHWHLDEIIQAMPDAALRDAVDVAMRHILHAIIKADAGRRVG